MIPVDLWLEIKCTRHPFLFYPPTPQCPAQSVQEVHYMYIYSENSNISKMYFVPNSRILAVNCQCCKTLGPPGFDISRNVIELIYSQSLCWWEFLLSSLLLSLSNCLYFTISSIFPEFRIGTFYSPMLPLIQVIKLFILFYVKRVCVIMAYCQTNSMYVVTAW